MASSTTIPPAALDPFDLGIHTPVNLNRGARAALLQNNPAAVNGTIGVSTGPGRMAQTPSSPLNAAATTTTATEGGCFGRRLAYMELKLLTALLVWNFKLKPCPESLSSYEDFESLTRKPLQCFVNIEIIKA